MVQAEQRGMRMQPARLARSESRPTANHLLAAKLLD
jgi:hypothetical protein